MVFSLISLLSRVHPLIIVFIISIFVSFLITISYRLFTDQKEMKRLKEKQKEHQTKIKELQKSGKHKESLDLQKESMDASMSYMRHSMKVSFITMLPLLFVFGWLSAHCVFLPLEPNTQFSTFVFFKDADLGNNATISLPPSLKLVDPATKTISKISLDPDTKKQLIDKNRALSDLRKTDTYNLIVWRIISQKEGLFNITINYKNTSVTKEVLITKNYSYKNPVKKSDDFTIVLGNRRAYFKFLGINFGWLGVYILTSIIFGNVFRKWLKVY